MNPGGNRKKIKGQELRHLASIRLNDCPKYKIEGAYIAQVVKVYDGDTITITMCTHKELPYYQYNIRMYGYDSPELRPPKNTPNRDQIVESAKSARDYLQKLILNKTVVVEVLPDDDKYGRLLCKVYIGAEVTRAMQSHWRSYVRMRDFNICVNDLMLEKGHGYAYYGGKKRT